MAADEQKRSLDQSQRMGFAAFIAASVSRGTVVNNPAISTPFRKTVRPTDCDNHFHRHTTTSSTDVYVGPEERRALLGWHKSRSQHNPCSIPVSRGTLRPTFGSKLITLP